MLFYLLLPLFCFGTRFFLGRGAVRKKGFVILAVNVNKYKHKEIFIFPW